MMKYICVTCGVQYSPNEKEPEKCMICDEARQYVNLAGQRWTTLENMKQSRKYENRIEKISDNIYKITTEPAFAIGQAAYFVVGKEHNVLWDSITYLDDETIQFIIQHGGIDFIAISHPHYYSSIIEWSKKFGATIYIHQADEKWIVHHNEYINLWQGESLRLDEQFTLHCLGGHFKGAAILHAEIDKGIVFSGDVIQIAADRNWVSFMYSYPNMIPLPISIVDRIRKNVNEMEFNVLYSALHKKVEPDAKKKVILSADRYIKALNGELFDT